MKKVMFVVVCLLIVSTMAFALESAPSNKVGYVKIACPGTVGALQYTNFGLPFVFWDVPTGNVPTYGTESKKPSDIIGSQPPCGGLYSAPYCDRIVRQDGAAIAYRTGTNCTWTGSLETGLNNMEPGRAYWYGNRQGTARSLVLAGEADTTAVGIPAVTITAPGTSAGIYVQYSWRDPRVVTRERLGLLTAGFTGGTYSTSDRLIAQQGGAMTYYTTTWVGTLASVQPGSAYWIKNMHMGHPWVYQYNASGASLMAPPEGDNGSQTVPTELMKLTPKAKTKATRSSAAN